MRTRQQPEPSSVTVGEIKEKATRHRRDSRGVAGEKTGRNNRRNKSYDAMDEVVKKGRQRQRGWGGRRNMRGRRGRRNMRNSTRERQGAAESKD